MCSQYTAPYTQCAEIITLFPSLPPFSLVLLFFPPSSFTSYKLASFRLEPKLFTKQIEKSKLSYYYFCIVFLTFN